MDEDAYTPQQYGKFGNRLHGTAASTVRHMPSNNDCHGRACHARSTQSMRRTGMKGKTAALAFAWAAFATQAAALGPAESFDTAAGNLIAVLRESAGSNQEQETLEPYGTVQVQLPDGSEVELETSWFR